MVDSACPNHCETYPAPRVGGVSTLRLVSLGVALVYLHMCYYHFPPLPSDWLPGTFVVRCRSHGGNNVFVVVGGDFRGGCVLGT
ncbi:chondroadherin [Sesbania bispinosa]|nr:chondroadherin [Sesbania bispinosa]